MAFWDNYATGQESANQNLMAPIQRQSALEQLTTQRQQNALSALNLQKQQMTYADMLGARNVTPPADTTTQQAQQPPAPPITAPTSSAAGQMGATPQVQPPKTAQDILNSPPSLDDLSKSSADLNAPSAPQQSAPSATAQPTSPGTATTPQAATPQPTASTIHGADYMNKLLSLRDYWTGKDPAIAKSYDDQYNAEATKQGQMAAFGVTNPADMATIQAKISMTAAHADMIEKAAKTIFEGWDKGGITAVNALAPQIRAMAPEMASFDPSKLTVAPGGQFMSTMLPDGSAVIFDRDHPKDFKVEPATELSIFRQGYMSQYPGADPSELSSATSQYLLTQAAAKRNINVVNAVPRETQSGVTDTGEAVFKDSHGGPPFTYSNGQQVRYDGKIFAKSEAINLGGNTPDPVTGLTPQQVKANAKALQDPVNIRTVQLINGVLPVAQKFRSAIDQLPDNTPISDVTGFLRSANIQLNNKQINDFQTFAVEFPREAQRAMVGSGQTAQKSLDQQGDLFSKSKTVGNLKSSLDIITGILQDRKTGVTTPIYQPSPQSPADPQIAPAGTTVAKKGGGVYTSDGKGGWK